ncbi:aqualysin-1-like isoform X1 [Ptychodera flava]|uniref:aqualysin-1-like isoform X1 n=1 Tax=Ptychodera flava TaxID=63121 RepID=UPI003969CFDE
MKVAALILALAVTAYARPLIAPLHRGDTNKLIPGRYIVQLKDSASKLDFDAVVRRVQGMAKDLSLGIHFHKRLSAMKSFVAEMSDKALTLVRHFDEIEFVEQDAIYSINAVGSWGLDRVDQVNLPLDDTYTPRGDGAGVNVYVIDTGVLTSHNDFGGRAAAFYDALGGNGEDCNGHGTHCAGTVGGTTYGVAKSASVYGVRVLSCLGFGSTSNIVSGMNEVASSGALPGVASMSLGGGASVALDNGVRTLVNAGFTTVVAAGNDNANACNYSPARAADAITVGSTTNSDARSSFSNFGTCVDIFAPGSDITSAWHTGDDATNTISGTSMACPHVAGAAAVLLGSNTNMTPAQVTSQLLSEASADKIRLPGVGSPNLLLYIG